LRTEVFPGALVETGARMRLSITFALGAVLVLPACQSMPAVSPSAAAADVTVWSHSVSRIRPPGAGCFTVSFPSTAWAPVACSTAKRLQSRFIGSGRDYTAQVHPRTISVAEGSFPKVVGLRTVITNKAGAGWSGTNAYSLQLNSQFFQTASCGAIAHCAGWVQFVYQNPPGKTPGDLLIWDWLVPTNGPKLSGCPPKAGWEFYAGFCVQTNHKSVHVPNQPITKLSEMTITGMAATDGDSIIFGVDGTEYAIRDAQSDDVTDLSKHWQSAEFNVFAPGNGATATFNAGTTITVGLDVDDGAKNAPLCEANMGTTAESNDLSFIKTPGTRPESAYPSIRFTESNVTSPGSASCLSLAGRGPATR
jgi:hypothetical protein